MGKTNSKEYKSPTHLTNTPSRKWQEWAKRPLKAWASTEDLAENATPGRPPGRPSMVSPNQPSEDSAEEVASRESPLSSMTTPEPSLDPSLNRSSETLSPTPSTPEEKPSPPWTLSTLSRDKAELSTVSATDYDDPGIPGKLY